MDRIRRYSAGITLSLACALVFALTFQRAWISEDAYVSFRVINHFLQGYGLRWNIDERVQAYTHPLWLLLHLPFCALYPHILVVNVALSVICAVAAVLLACTVVTSSPWHKALLVLLPLALSNSFKDFAVCGLENPLSFLLFAWFVRELAGPDRFFRLCFIASLCLVNRFDNLFMLAPVLAWRGWRERHAWRWRPFLVASAPFILWCGFAVFYYGFFLPNSKYAKTGAGIPPGEFYRAGASLHRSICALRSRFRSTCSPGVWGCPHAAT